MLGPHVNHQNLAVQAARKIGSKLLRPSGSMKRTPLGTEKSPPEVQQHDEGIYSMLAVVSALTSNLSLQGQQEPLQLDLKM